MFVKEIMKSPPIMVTPSTTIKEAVMIMSKNNIGSIIIGTPQKIEGIFSERDLIKKCLNLDIKNTSISKVMTKKVITIKEDQIYLRAFEIISQKNIRKIPVVDKDGICIGIVSIKDLIEISCLELERENKELISYIISNPIINSKLED